MPHDGTMAAHRRHGDALCTIALRGMNLAGVEGRGPGTLSATVPRRASGSRVGAEVAVAEVADAGHHVGVLVEPLVDGGGDELDRREAAVKRADAFGDGDEVDEDDAVLGDALVEENLDGGEGGAAGGEHGVEEEDVARGDVVGERGVVEVGLLGHLVALDQDLADADRAAQGAELGLHALASPGDGDAAELLREAKAVVVAADGGLDLAGLEGEQVEAGLEEEPEDAARVEDEVIA